MRKGNLIRAFILTVLFGCVAYIIFALKQNNTTSQGHSFFKQFFISGGPIVWFVLFPISLLMAYLSIENLLVINRKNLVPKNNTNNLAGLYKEKGQKELLNSLKDKHDLISTAIKDGFNKGGSEWYRMKSAAFESLQERAGKLLRRIEWLNLIGGVSPMIGLFGTVFGMIKLFNAIVASGGQPQPAQLADGIGVALVTTFWGLFAAIPALAVYGIFRNRIDVLASDAFEELEMIMPTFESELKKQKPAIQKDKKITFTKVPIVNTDKKTEKKNDKKVSS